MLTRLRIRNFKRIEEADIELGQSVVLIGHNNSGKTTALQALALWVTGLKTWNAKNAKRKGKTSPEKRSGATINRRDLTAIPVPIANLLWRDLHARTTFEQGGEKHTQNVRIDIIVEGIVKSEQGWECGLEFDLANEESIYCRPLRLKSDGSERMLIPKEASDVEVAFLPPMSGLAATEPKWEPGRINVLLGEGQTAQVLRNLCYRICTEENGDKRWTSLSQNIQSLFGAKIEKPDFIAERGEITMNYQEAGTKLDLSAAGKGMQQTLLLLAHLYANPGSVLLLDEPDAHLEILRQRQIYNMLTEIAASQGSQVIAASHSEVVLREAADKHVVIAFFIGSRPHRIDDRGSQLMKSLRDIPFEDYYEAQAKGWILYLEGATDLAILKALAKKIGHQAQNYLDDSFVHYIGSNLPNLAQNHFFGLREAQKNLRGVALFDRLDKELIAADPLVQLVWRKREIENYLARKESLLRFAEDGGELGRSLDPNDMLDNVEIAKRRQAMEVSIKEMEQALSTVGKDVWSDEIKASDDFLDHLFKNFYNRLQTPPLFKSSYYQLADFLERDEIDPEIGEKLDAILQVAQSARPVS